MELKKRNEKEIMRIHEVQRREKNINASGVITATVTEADSDGT
jgi:hypothetical protein